MYTKRRKAMAEQNTNRPRVEIRLVAVFATFGRAETRITMKHRTKRGYQHLHRSDGGQQSDAVCQSGIEPFKPFLRAWLADDRGRGGAAGSSMCDPR